MLLKQNQHEIFTKKYIDSFTEEEYLLLKKRTVLIYDNKLYQHRKINKDLIVKINKIAHRRHHELVTKRLIDEELNNFSNETK